MYQPQSFPSPSSQECALPFTQGYPPSQCVCSPFTLSKRSLPRTLYLFIPLISRAVSDENLPPCSGMVSSCPFPSERLKYKGVSGALSVQACHRHTPTAPPSVRTPPGAQPLLLSCPGKKFGGVLQALRVLAWLKPLSPFMLLQSSAWEEAANLSLSPKVQPVDSLKIS